MKAITSAKNTKAKIGKAPPPAALNNIACTLDLLSGVYTVFLLPVLYNRWA
jgi:hypothetical protein